MIEYVFDNDRSLQTKCENKECEKKNDCKRYMDKGTLMNFQSVCHEDSNYKYFLKKRSKQ